MTMDSMTNDAERIAEVCDRFLPLKTARLHRAYFYKSLPFCVIDAVYSIGTSYSSAVAVIDRYGERFDLERYRESDAYPSRAEQQSIAEFLEIVGDLDPQRIADEIFGNRQRTSPRGGILKAEAVLRFARTLAKHGVDHFQDIPTVLGSAAFAHDILAIPGQGVSLRYFFTLAGTEETIKPDRVIFRFVSDALGRNVFESEALTLLTETVALLRPRYPHLTLRLLDATIWEMRDIYERIRPAILAYRRG